MRKSLGHGFAGVSLGLLTVLLLKWSSFFEHYTLLRNQKPIEVPGLGSALLVILLGILILFPRRRQPWACGFVLLVSQVVVFMDASYYRFFKDLPSLYLLPAWMQTGRAGESLTSLVTARDALIFLPWLVFLVLLIPLRRFHREEERDPRVGVLVILSGLVFFALAWFDMHPVRHTQLKRRFQNISQERIFGPQFYHLYDVFEWARVQLGAEGGGTFDPDLVQKVIDRSRKMSTEDTPWKGRYKGRDFIFLQLESLEYFAVDAEVDGKPVMPFLHQAEDRVAFFRLFDQTHLGRSADGQFIYLNSLHPPATRPLAFTYPSNYFFALPRMFLEKGYRTIYMEPTVSSFWNAGTISESYGFTRRYFQDDMPPKDRERDVRGWGLTDFALYDKVVEYGHEEESPFFAYVVTVMCHHPYNERSNPPVDWPPKRSGYMVRRYLRCAASRDRAIKELVENLAKTERGRKTVLFMAGDHDANLPKEEMSELGYPVYPEREAVPAFLGSVEEFLGEGGEKLKQPRDFGGQMDVAPTLGHVFSLNMEESVFVGWNLFATQNRGPHHGRLGTWMDQAGRIHDSEESGDSQVFDQFRVSEMLLQGDKIKAFRSRQSR